MNAKQRRQLERRTRYKISLESRPGEKWLEYDDRLESAIAWCKKKIKGEYVVQNKFDTGVFKFQRESDAVHFSLVWL